MLQGIKNAIKASIISPTGKVSSTRISSYFILGSILFAAVGFVAVDIVNAISMWRNGRVYEIPINHIILFGTILTHHLFLLGINKKHEVNFNSKEKPSEISDNPDGDDEYIKS